MDAESNPLERLNKVVDGTKLCLGVKTVADKDDGTRPGRIIRGSTRNSQLERDLVNVDRFLDQARFDPSVSPDVLKDWEDKLMRHVTTQAAKYTYADLYGKLVTEWLSSEKRATADGDVEIGESFEELPSAKKLEARKEWEKSVFEPAKVDIPVLKEYLERLFITNKKDSLSALSDLRKQVESFENGLMHSSQFDSNTLKWIIKSLQTSDLLSNEKREVLGDFLSNDVILSEIADVLNMRLETLDQWSWGDHILVDQRRQINGTFQIHMQEDILQAIFLHFIGVKWSVCFKTRFRALRNHARAWGKNRPEISKIDRLRREYFLANSSNNVSGNLNSKRSNIQRKHYFINQLLDHEKQQIQHNEGEEEADYADYVQVRPKRAKQTARKSVQAQLASSSSLFGTSRSTAHRRAAQMEEEKEESDTGGARFLLDASSEESESDNEETSEKNPMEAKQGLLHILATEIMINTYLNGEIACFRTTFESWNPLLPHDTILAILEFFGVSTKWRTFFKSFLEAPLRFADDHQSSEPRLRRRGTPGSHALSDVFGEAVLFCLDFSVNQNTNGALLHRLYDDLWFWHKDYEVCATAWASVQEFAGITGAQVGHFLRHIEVLVLTSTVD